MVKKFFKFILIVVPAGLLGVVLASFLWGREEELVFNRGEEFPLINPVVTSGLDKHFIINFKPLKEEFMRIRDAYPQDTYIYFTYLNNAAWIGFDERSEFTAASTVKVPLAMALLKAVEEKKLLLNDTYALEELDIDANFGELYKEARPDDEFAVDELLKIMLEQSDNTAQLAISNIFRRIGMDDPLYNVYGFLGWGLNQNMSSVGSSITYSKVNLKTLANLFIALYDAKYVSPEDSELILRHLANTPFDTKIDAGVPDSVTVSHKIGVAGSDLTYSDCGIVYAPNRHYLLCLGSVGADENMAARFMRDISEATYNYVINN
jgi:beta-lactamase class A